jgi:hypothetical protein
MCRSCPYWASSFYVVALAEETKHTCAHTSAVLFTCSAFAFQSGYAVGSTRGAYLSQTCRLPAKTQLTHVHACTPLLLQMTAVVSADLAALRATLAAEGPLRGDRRGQAVVSQAASVAAPAPAHLPAQPTPQPAAPAKGAQPRVRTIIECSYLSYAYVCSNILRPPPPPPLHLIL